TTASISTSVKPRCRTSMRTDRDLATAFDADVQRLTLGPVARKPPNSMLETWPAVLLRGRNNTTFCPWGGSSTSTLPEL
ncbi:hypothetical protein Q6289_30355, partial [Klebsiella pneumoniae]